MAKRKKNKMRPVYLALAAHWLKDVRTIKAWFERGDQMLNHPDSKSIIKKLIQAQ